MKTRFCPISALAALPVALASLPAIASGAPKYTAWSVPTPVAEVNDLAFPDGCPIESRDGLSLYIASNRTGTLGANDIWAADRASKNEPFGEPQNLGSPVNTGSADFCPTPIQGSFLMFVSERPGEEGAETCGTGPGLGDMYIIRRNAAYGWGEPQHLGCIDDGTGPNSTAAEFSPSLVQLHDGTYLYFSSTSSGNHDIYRSKQLKNGKFGPPTPVTELNTEFDDRMPNISSDGLEVVFSSTRPMDAKGVASFGSFDVFYARRNNTKQKFSAPVNLGPAVNTAGSETRSTISWDLRRLYFGRDGEIYSASRKKK